MLYNKSLNEWSLGEQRILFPENLNVSLHFASGDIEILGKQNLLFSAGPVIYNDDQQQQHCPWHDYYYNNGDDDDDDCTFYFP